MTQTRQQPTKQTVTINGVQVGVETIDITGLSAKVHRLFGGKKYGVDEIIGDNGEPTCFIPWYEIKVNEPWKREEVYYRENRTVVHRDSLQSAIEYIIQQIASD